MCEEIVVEGKVETISRFLPCAGCGEDIHWMDEPMYSSSTGYYHVVKGCALSAELGIPIGELDD